MPKGQPKQREDFTSKVKSSYAAAEESIKKKWEEFRGEAKLSARARGYGRKAMGENVFWF